MNQKLCYLDAHLRHRIICLFRYPYQPWILLLEIHLLTKSLKIFTLVVLLNAVVAAIHVFPWLLHRKEHSHFAILAMSSVVGKKMVDAKIGIHLSSNRNRKNKL